MKPTRDLSKASASPGRALLKTLSADAFARLLAQEYIRNGMKVAEAYATLTGAEMTRSNTRTLTQMTRGHMDAFVDEIKVQLANADIELERVVAQLWTVLQTSILDFFGTDGKVLPVKELKKLPRCVQAIIQTVDVKSVELPIKDANGNLMLDDTGRPYLRMEQRVHITIMNKLDAHRQLAALMKWTAPATVVNNFNTVNIGVAMASADDRRRRLERVYEADAAPLRAHPDDPAA